ncbi:MAG: universal stress protein [Dehalococcoidia bacterium]|nr:MAG: universal stress protein [Dehalococcoidia bacterium]
MPSNSVLAPLDKSSRDRIVLPYLIRISKEYGFAVQLLHVVPVTRNVIPHAIRSTETYVDAFEKQLAKQGADAHAIVRRGDPAAEIVKVATEYDAALIIMSTRGRRGFDKMLLGSVEDVMSRCSIPVTLINEATAHTELDTKVWAQSSYMAGVIYGLFARGRYTDDDARAEITRLASLGLDHDEMIATYETLKKGGGSAEWTDLEFQVETLKDYMPDALGPCPDKWIGADTRPTSIDEHRAASA